MRLPQLKFSEGLTISAWARLLNPTPYGTIFSLEITIAERSILWVGIEKDNKVLHIHVPGDAGFIRPLFSGYDPHFTHVALVWDPDNAQARLYLYGAQAAVGVITDHVANIANSLTHMTLVIGRSKHVGQRYNSGDGQVSFAVCHGHVGIVSIL